MFCFILLIFLFTNLKTNMYWLHKNPNHVQVAIKYKYEKSVLSLLNAFHFTKAKLLQLFIQHIKQLQAF